MHLKLYMGLLAASIVAASSCCTKPALELLAPQRIERANSTAITPGRLVVLVSIDGLAPRFLASTPTPFLDRLAKNGRAAKSAYTVMPSKTLPAHTSMLSGVGPEVHGFRFNFYQSGRQLEIETVFSQCRHEALRCGLFAGKSKLAHFAEFETGVERFEWQPESPVILERARDYILSRSPSFVMIHLPEVDWAGHKNGWGSEAQRAVIEATDALLGAFMENMVAQVKRPLTLIVTADHGGHKKKHGSDLPEDMLIPWLAWGDGVDASRALDRVEIADTAATVLGLLGLEVPTHWTGLDRLSN